MKEITLKDVTDQLREMNANFLDLKRNQDLESKRQQLQKQKESLYPVGNVLESIRKVMEDQKATFRKMFNLEEDRVELEKRRDLMARVEKGDRNTSGIAGVFGGLFVFTLFKNTVDRFRKSVERFTNSLTGNSDERSITSIILAPIMGPLRAIASLIRVGGPVAAAVYLMYEVFKDIGSNENFISVLESISKFLTEDVPFFFSSVNYAIFGVSEEMTAFARVWENIRMALQNFVTRILAGSFKTLSGILRSIGMILHGDIIAGANLLVNTVIEGTIRLLDIIATGILELFGANFGSSTLLDESQAILDNLAYNLRNGLFIAIGALVTAFDRVLPIIRTTTEGVRTGLTAIISSFSASITPLRNGFQAAIAVMPNWVELFQGISNRISTIGNMFRTFGRYAGMLFNVVRRAFLPLTLIITAWDTISEAWQGYEDSGIIGALEGAINGFVTSLITKPLDMIVAAVAWITDQFGFDSTADYIRSFSFTDLFRRLTGSIFGFIRGAFDFAGTVFTEPQVAMAQLSTVVTDFVSDLVSWVRNIFDFLPSIEDITSAIYHVLPSWMQRAIDMAGAIVNSPANAAASESMNRFQENFEFRTGTRGFRDFGIETPALLHGVEAVVPRNTPAGDFLANNFDDNWRPVMKRLSGIQSAALGGNSAPIVITNAPVVAPVSNRVTGATHHNNQRFTSVGGNSDSGIGLGRFAN